MIALQIKTPRKLFIVFVHPYNTKAKIACHGKNQPHTPIIISDGAYIGMRCTLISGKTGITIGENAIIGAASLVNTSIPPNKTAYGVPAKIK